MYVELSHVSFAHEGSEPLFINVSQRFVPGISAIVGANGAGKSTLLSLITGALPPSEGSVRLEPRSARVSLCQQTVEQLTESIAGFAETHTRSAQRLRGVLALQSEQISRWDALSPGERRRFQIGACLADEPEVLLLDEPTNHVDAQARELIVKALRSFRGVCLLVSHDRLLVDALATRTMRIQRGELHAVEGGYSEARAVWEQARRDELARRAELVREVHKTERKLRDARRVQASADRNRSTSARMRNASDRDARTMGARNLADWAEARAGRSVSILRDQAEARRAELAEVRVEKELGRGIFARFVPCPRPKLAVLERAQVCRGEHPVLRDVSLTIARDARIRITGPNGAGKSTLLDALHGAVPERERVLYLPQELTPQQARSWLTRTQAMPRSERGQVLEVLAALGVDPDRLLASAQPSPGEAQKLALAHGLARSVWGLFLDEPTNHLDLPSIERIEAALADYPGALLVVTHDPTFMAEGLSSHWALAEGKLARS
jgi:ATPase subunit of ABC transporter with duplicated ATPase domains